MEDKEKKEKNMQNRKRVKGEREKENEGEKYEPKKLRNCKGERGAQIQSDIRVMAKKCYYYC